MPTKKRSARKNTTRGQSTKERHPSRKKKAITPPPVGTSASPRQVDLTSLQQQSNATTPLHPVTPRDSLDTAMQPQPVGMFALFCSPLTQTEWASAKQLAALSIATSETLARGVIDYQKWATDWGRATPWAPLIHWQVTLAHHWVEGAAVVARQFWGIENQPYKKE